jgi:hypothetical protein
MRLNGTKQAGIVEILVLLVTLPAFAQEKPALEARPEIPVKVQVVLTEFDGSQKISSLPYTLNMLATGRGGERQWAHLRLGVKVPILTSGTSYTYQDVGTNIDSTALMRDDGGYRLDLKIERSSVTNADKGTDWKPGESRPSNEPLIRSFREEFTVVVKDGQTVQGTSAVDPVTGHVLKVEVTLNTLK